jgi:alpha-glucosidase
MNETFLWWQRGIIYQVYPRSFMDSNGDGVGDLPGIISKLDYLQWLGVNAIWLSPIFPSPMADFGYDVSDYTDIHPLFGTLADFDILLAEAHKRDLKVIIDYVPNHTSDQHPWFLESRASRHNPKRDWYVWRDPASGGGPPNNWRGVFGGSAWEWDATTGQYYYHAYLKEQPDLNWRHPEVQAAMLDVLRFWLERGVDGFRVDALRQLIKDVQLRDNPPNPAHHPTQGPYHALLPVYTTDRPEVLERVADMRRIVDQYPERLLIGELYLPIDKLMRYYGVDGSGVHLPFNFHLILTPWDTRQIATLISTYEAALPVHGWPNWVLGNHDQHRLASRVGEAQSRIAAMLLLTLRGTPTLYYGDELGMHDVSIPPELVQDPWEKNVPGLGLGRDPERTPMPWDNSLHAGFTTGTPWLPVVPDYQTVSVAAQRGDPTSMLALYRRLIAHRRATPALAIGTYTALEARGDVLAYVRTFAGHRCLVVLNLGAQPTHFTSDQVQIRGHVELSTHLDRADEDVRGKIVLRGDEGVIVTVA